jgi:hypothetical protein
MCGKKMKIHRSSGGTADTGTVTWPHTSVSPGVCHAILNTIELQRSTRWNLSNVRMINDLPLSDVTGQSLPGHMLCNAIVDDNGSIEDIDIFSWNHCLADEGLIGSRFSRGRLFLGICIRCCWNSDIDRSFPGSTSDSPGVKLQFFYAS